MKIIKLSFLICLCIVTLLSKTLCWKNEGHMIIASIVKQDLLNNKRSDVLDFINQLSKMVTELQHEKVSSYVEVVTWPDEVKRYFMAFLNSSHSNHIPFNNTDNSNDFIDLKSNNVDVYNTYFNGIRTTQNSLSFLTQGIDTLFSWNEKNIENLDHQFEKSFMLIYFSHIMGDHHQPMHICSLYNEKFPKGDNGGLYFNITINKGLLTKEYDSKNIKLKEKERLIHNRLNKNDFKNKDEKSITTNLHEYWNYLFYKINNISLPLEKQGENEINFFSKSIMTEYSRENLTDEIEFDSINMNKNYDINMKKLKNKEALNVKNMHMKEIKNLEYKFLVENSKNLSNEEDYDEYIRRLSIYLKSRIEEWTLENYNICKVIYKELLCESCDTISRTTLDNFYSISKKQLALAAYRTSNIIQNSYDIMLLKKELNKLKGKVNEKKYFSNTWYYVAGVIILKIVLFR